MRASGTAWHGPTAGVAGAGEQPGWEVSSRRRTWRRILITVGGLLVGFGALVVLVPVDGSDEGRSCGGAPAVAAAVGLHGAAQGDSGWCRSEARSNVAVGLLVFVLPGALLLRWQLRGARRARLAGADPMGGSPGVGTSGWSASPRDALPGVATPSDVVPRTGVDPYLTPRKPRVPDEAASRTRPAPAGMPDHLVLYRSSWWLAGLPGGVALLVLLFAAYIDPEVWDTPDDLLLPAALWLLWRGVSAVRGRPLLILDRRGLTDRRRPRFHATWDEVAAVEFVPRTGGGANKLLVRLRHDRTAPHRWPGHRRRSSAERRLNLDGLSAPAHDIAKAAEHLHAPRDGDVMDRAVTTRGRPSRLAAVAAIVTAIIAAGIGWYIRPSGDFEPGDCYSESGANRFEQVPCDQPHDGEIFLVLDHPADQGARMPNSYSLSAWAEAQCRPAFRSYTGKAGPSDDGLSFVFWVPTDAMWSDGDREITCAVVNRSGAQLTDRIGAS